MPYYTLDSYDRLVRKGTLISGRPIPSVLYPIIGISQTAKYFNISLPRVGDNHLNLTARLIEESANAFREKFESDAFYVLIYPVAGCTSITPYLDQTNIKYLDYSTLITRDNKEFWQPDRHPTAKGYKIVAEKLAIDLGIIGRKEDD